MIFYIPTEDTNNEVRFIPPDTQEKEGWVNDAQYFARFLLFYTPAEFQEELIKQLTGR